MKKKKNIENLQNAWDGFKSSTSSSSSSSTEERKNKIVQMFSIIYYYDVLTYYQLQYAYRVVQLQLIDTMQIH